MNEEEKNVQRFETRVRQLILNYQSQVKNNAVLQEEISRKNEEINNLRQQLLQYENKFKTLTIAKIIGSNKEDINLAKNKLSNMIKNIDKCIKMIS